MSESHVRAGMLYRSSMQGSGKKSYLETMNIVLTRIGEMVDCVALLGMEVDRNKDRFGRWIYKKELSEFSGNF